MGARSTNPTQSFFDDFFRSGTDAFRAAGQFDGTMKFAMFGGGGSGGGWSGGGGGGGGYVEEDEGFFKSTPYSFTVGAAGATPGPGPSTPEANHRGNDGGNTTLVTESGTFTAYGGGGGNSVPQSDNGLGNPGGSGGGGYNPSPPPSGGGLGNAVTGTTNPAQASPPQPKVLSRVQGYPGGSGAAGDGMMSGGGGAGGAGSNASPTQGGDGGAAVVTANFGPYNGTYGGGGGGCSTGGGAGGSGGGNAGDGVQTNETAKNATGYANGGGGVREAGHPGGAATAGLILIRVPNAFNASITNGGASQTVSGDHRYIRLTAPGNITFVDA